MAQTNSDNLGYSPAMDGKSHEATYDAFVKFATLGTVVIVCWMVALAIGGVKAGWGTAILGVIVSTAAGVVGAMMPSVQWRAPAAVLVLLALLFAVY